MAGLSQTVHQALAAWFRGTPMISAPANLTIALSFGDPLQDGSGLVEPNGNGYSRQPITVTSAPSNPAPGTTLTSSNAVIFGPVVNSPWGTLTHGAIFDDQGRMLASGPLGIQRSPPLGDTVSFAIGAFQFKLR